MQHRCKILENIRGANKSDTRAGKFPPLSKLALTTTNITVNISRITSLFTSNASPSTSYKMCSLSKNNAHPINRCVAFDLFSIQQRCDYVKKNKLCFICTSFWHIVSACASKSTRKRRHKQHHTCLHLDGHKSYFIAQVSTSSSSVDLMNSQIKF